MRPVLVGVAGGSASGKSTLVTRLAEALGVDQVLVIRHDAYYRDRSHLEPDERAGINYDHPDALETELLVAHLEALRDGRGVDVPSYDFTRHIRAPVPVRVEPQPIIIVDGILVLADPRIRELLDVAVYVDAPADVRLGRRLRRDVRERGRAPASVLRQYLDTVRPMHLAHVEPSRAHAHLVLDGDGGGDGVVRVLSLIQAAGES